MLDWAYMLLPIAGAGTAGYAAADAGFNAAEWACSG